jgi:FAD/FMN-containing dehydrogenase
METIIDHSTLERLRAGLRGAVYVPGEEGYDEGREAFNLNAHQHPALVVMAAGPADVVAAVRLARDEGLGVGVLATGHAVAAPCDGGVLINTSRMRGVRVDPEAQTARVEAGALWADVTAETQLFGLAEEMRPYETGATYLYFLDLDGASPERVRAAYAPEDWERLVELKDRYDRENLFRFNRNIPPSSARE